MTNKLLNLAKKWLIASIAIISILGTFLPAINVAAIDPLTISNINITSTDKSAVITWNTNRTAYAKIQYGLNTGAYTFTIQTNQKATTQTMTIFGLSAETTYYFKIMSDDGTNQVYSTERSFKTSKAIDNQATTISGVSVVYTTGSTATIQWQTDEDATTEVEYGMSQTYGASKVDGRLVRSHDITLTGLIDGTSYHFRVKSKDKSNNISTWSDSTFSTKVTNVSDNQALTIYNIKPAAENDVNIKQTSVIISWWTNKLSEGWVRFGTSPAYGQVFNTTPPRDFMNSVTITNLKPNTTYYFEINGRDVNGKTANSGGFSFKTAAVDQNNTGSGSTGSGTGYTGTGSITGSTGGTVLGISNCDVNLSSDFGYFGLYYNLTPAHPDFETWQQTVKTAGQNDWYSAQYYAFSRVDSTLDFGQNFFPVDEKKANDPHDFAVHWRAIMNVPDTGTYTYKVSSDDDSWVFVDDILSVDLHGIHNNQDKLVNMSLTPGYHKIEIYYADRQSSRAAFTFVNDKKIKINPLPDGCEISDVLAYNKGLGQGYGAGGGYVVGTNNGSGGKVLGASNIDDDPYRGYACNPDLGYTKIKALYKTSDSPDIWAILETGQRSYITSPLSFNEYQCRWNKVKTVSRALLNSYASATLVRTPTDPVIYHLFQRPDVKWLKINIPSPTVFISYPNNYWGNVARLNHYDLEAYPKVQLIKLANKPEVYLIDGANKRHIATEAVFKAHYFEWSEVVELNQTHFDSYDNGAELTE
ncbi:MAG: fibronectin type III domain-containing protein [Patescibacteria group bacterium]|nr:fibronectin type III domain-containing protein [Patescibacteria group bacterium]